MAGTQQEREEAHKWLLSFHEVGDSLDTSKAEIFYEDDAVLNFGNNPPVKGKKDIFEKFFAPQFLNLESMKHDILSFDVVPDRIYLYATITYVFKGDPERKKIQVTGLAAFHKKPEENKIRQLDVFLDPSPMHERVKYIQSLKQ